MVTTRRKQSAAVGETAKKPKASGNVSVSMLPSGPGKSHSNAEAITETIGSRLRKRRRSKTPPPSISRKSFNAQQKSSSESKKTSPGIKGTFRGQSTYHGEPPYHKSDSPANSNLGEALEDVSDDNTQVGTPQSSSHEDFHSVQSNDTASNEAFPASYAAQSFNTEGVEVVLQEILETQKNKSSPSTTLRIQSLPIMDSLAGLVLQKLTQVPFNDALDMVTQPDSEAGANYAALKKVFDETKKIYSPDHSFLDIVDFEVLDQSAVDTVRKANLATFVSSVFGSQEVGFYHLNKYFLDTFVAEGGRILKSHAELFLELKTHAYVSALAKGDQRKEDILEELFPSDFEIILLSRRAEKELKDSEVEFVQRVAERRKALQDEPDTEAVKEALQQKYEWDDFVREVGAYVSKNFASLVGPPSAQKYPSGHPLSPSRMEREHRKLVAEARLRLENEHPQKQSQGQHQHNGESRSSETGNNGVGVEHGGHSPNHGYTMVPPRGQHTASPQNQNPQQPNQPFLFQFQQHQGPAQMPNPPPGYYYQPNLQWNDHPHSGIPLQQQIFADANGIPFHSQAAPTQVLYERARQAATNKSSPSSRRAGTPSQRRPWSQEEENALMAGLDRVKGPHWSQILAMFGSGGTINEVLKDRNQVQLKDKARNLKLFFLKQGVDVPYYLQFVTGELKTRAPAQAARYYEITRANGGTINEDRGHVEAVMALAGTGVGNCRLIQAQKGRMRNAPITNDIIRSAEPSSTVGERSTKMEGVEGHPGFNNSNRIVPATQGSAYLAPSMTPEAQACRGEKKVEDKDLFDYLQSKLDADQAAKDAAEEAVQAIAMMRQGGGGLADYQPATNSSSAQYM